MDRQSAVPTLPRRVRPLGGGRSSSDRSQRTGPSMGHSTSAVRRWTRPRGSRRLRSVSEAGRAVAEREPRQRTAPCPSRRPRARSICRRSGCPPRSASTRSRSASARPEDPSHLAQGLEPIREELEALLTEDEIQRRPHRTAASRAPAREPCHVRVGHYCAPDGQHGRVMHRGRLHVPWGPRARPPDGVTAPVPLATSKAQIAAARRVGGPGDPGSHQAEALNGMALVDFGGDPPRSRSTPSA